MRRFYNEPKRYEQALELIDEASGSQFDPNLVRIFKSIPKEKIEACAPEALKIGLED